MDTARFDRLTRSLRAASSRRTLVAGLTVLGLIGGAIPEVATAKKRKKRKKCKGGKTRCGKKCVSTDSSQANCGRCGNPCEGELSCEAGQCQCAKNVCLVLAAESETIPYFVAIDPEGNLVTSEFDELGVYSSRGSRLRTIGEFGIDPGEFDDPSGIAVDGAGVVYVADSGNDRIQRLHPGGAIDVWELEEFSFPEGIAISTQGVVYATFDDQVHRFGQDGQVVYSWGPDGSADTFFEIAGDIAVDENGAVYVLDEFADEVYRFTDNGPGDIQPDWSVGAPGADPGEFRDPRGLAVGEGRIYVADTENLRVQALRASDGSFLFDWPIVVDYGPENPNDVAVGADGRIYVTSFFGINIFDLGAGAPA